MDDREIQRKSPTRVGPSSGSVVARLPHPNCPFFLLLIGRFVVSCWLTGYRRHCVSPWSHRFPLHRHLTKGERCDVDPKRSEQVPPPHAVTPSPPQCDRSGGGLWCRHQPRRPARLRSSLRPLILGFWASAEYFSTTACWGFAQYLTMTVCRSAQLISVHLCIPRDCLLLGNLSDGQHIRAVIRTLVGQLGTEIDKINR